MKLFIQLLIIDAIKLDQKIDSAHNKDTLKGLIDQLKTNGIKKALSSIIVIIIIIIIPVIMLICFLIIYFRSKGRYKPIELSEGTAG